MASREAHEKSIEAMFEHICHQLMEWFLVRRQIDTNTGEILVSSVAKTIQASLSMYARRYRIIASNNDVYEVFSIETARNYIVKVAACTCSCWDWQASGIPCVHALAVCLNRRDDPQSYAASFFSLEAYRGTYANPIFPPNSDAADHVQRYISTPEPLVTTDGADSDENSDENTDILPPSMRRPTGRPKKKRHRSGTEKEGN